MSKTLKQSILNINEILYKLDENEIMVVNSFLKICLI